MQGKITLVSTKCKEIYREELGRKIRKNTTYSSAQQPPAKAGGLKQGLKVGIRVKDPL
jgi:hypothetical protein